MKSEKIIGSLKILHKKWEVVEFDASDKAKIDGEGFCAGEDQQIGIFSELSPEGHVEVLIHEVTHAIFETFSAEKKDEESICIILGIALACIFKDNPWFINHIKQKLRK